MCSLHIQQMWKTQELTCAGSSVGEGIVRVETVPVAADPCSLLPLLFHHWQTRTTAGRRYMHTCVRIVISVTHYNRSFIN